jgi:uncharacterized protein YgiM (DUF1202 family)
MEKVYDPSMKSNQNVRPSPKHLKKVQQKYNKKKTGSQANFPTPRNFEAN